MKGNKKNLLWSLRVPLKFIIYSMMWYVPGAIDDEMDISKKRSSEVVRSDSSCLVNRQLVTPEFGVWIKMGQRRRQCFLFVFFRFQCLLDDSRLVGLLAEGDTFTQTSKTAGGLGEDHAAL